jgi:DNA-binding transcriptional LysR family regulator
VLHDNHFPERERIATILKGFGVIPRVTTSIDTVEGAKRLVEEGLGVALLPRTSVIDELRRGSLVRVTMTNANLPTRSLVALRRNDAGRMPKGLMDIVKTLQKLERAAV